MPGTTPQNDPSLSRKILAGVGFAAIIAAVAALGALSNAPHIDGWYADAEKVPWSPPGWLFAPAWTLLYALMAISGWILWRKGFRGPGEPSATRPQLTVFIVQLVLNCLWSPVFFALHPEIGAAAWWIAAVIMVALIAAVARLTAISHPVSPTVAWLQAPYLAWLCFAATLNIGIIVLNT